MKYSAACPECDKILAVTGRRQRQSEAKQSKAWCGMSSAFQSSSFLPPPGLSTPLTSQGDSPFHVFALNGPSGAVSTTPSVSEAPTPAPQVESTSSNHVEEPPQPVATVDVQAMTDEALRRGKHKGRRAEEVDAMAQTAARHVACPPSETFGYSFSYLRIATRLASDHAAVLHPDVETPFVDAADVVRRLLPYHVYQHPLEDLLSITQPHGKGKRKATEEDLLREEIAGKPHMLCCLPFATH